MFVFLSSGASSRYRQDILRSIAMPLGTHLQFRYDLKWVAPAIRQRLSADHVKGTKSLIAYIDQYDKTKPFSLIPCRFAILEKATVHGTTVSLILSLQEFAYAENITVFNTEMTAASGGNLPAWQTDKTVKGAYWLEISQDPTSVIRDESLTVWEKIVVQLDKCVEYADEPYYYVVRELVPVASAWPRSSKAMSPQNGIYNLKAGAAYELQLYHFHPRTPAQGAWLRVDAPGRSVTFATNPLLNIDSRYDQKVVRFVAGGPLTALHDILSFGRINGDPKAFPDRIEFDLSIRIRPAIVCPLIYGTVLGALLAAPNIVSALSNPSLRESIVMICSVSGVSGLLAGIMAVFGLRKSV